MRKSRGKRHDRDPDGRLCRMCGTVVTIAADGRCPLGHRVESPAPPQPSPPPAQTAPVAQSPAPGGDAAALPPVAALPAPPPRLLLASGDASGAPSPAAGESHWDPDDALAWLGDHKTPTAFPAEAPAEAPADAAADASGDTRREASADALAWLAEHDAPADAPAERPQPSPAYAPSDGGLRSALDELLAWDEPAPSASDVATEEVATPEPPAAPGQGVAGQELTHGQDQQDHTAPAPAHGELAPTDEHAPADEHAPTEHAPADEHADTEQDDTEQGDTQQDGTARRRLATLLAAACLGVMTGLAAAALVI